MNIDHHSFPANVVLSNIQHYNEKKYWKRREYVIKSQGSRLLKLLYLVYIKRTDSHNNASLGTDLCHGADFGSIPKFPHGLNGIIVSPDANIGKNCKIFHQVTIGNDYKDIYNVPSIGNNVTIYPGAKIVGKVKIGDNCQIGAGACVIGDIKIGKNCSIGAGCVVFKDVPDNTIVLSQMPRYVAKNIEQSV